MLANIYSKGIILTKMFAVLGVFPEVLSNAMGKYAACIIGPSM